MKEIACRIMICLITILKEFFAVIESIIHLIYKVPTAVCSVAIINEMNFNGIINLSPFQIYFNINLVSAIVIFRGCFLFVILISILSLRVSTNSDEKVPDSSNFVIKLL